jgi:hypothetical protein
MYVGLKVVRGGKSIPLRATSPVTSDGTTGTAPRGVRGPAVYCDEAYPRHGPLQREAVATRCPCGTREGEHGGTVGTKMDTALADLLFAPGMRVSAQKHRPTHDWTAMWIRLTECLTLRAKNQ